MTIQKPTNAIADQVVRLRNHNHDLDVQIEQIERLKGQNEEAIAALSPMAEWEEIEEPVEPPKEITTASSETSNLGVE